MSNGENQNRILPRYQSEEMEILNISFRRVGIEPTTSHGLYVF